ncbi:hypothetical protein P4O66_018984, partial [Electrophorus voltai]
GTGMKGKGELTPFMWRRSYPRMKGKAESALFDQQMNALSTPSHSHAMGQPAPDLSPKFPLGSNGPRWILADTPDREGSGSDGSTPRLDGGRHPPAHLCPPPLFRSIGLMGLPASLPPHRRLRSALHRERAVLPATASGTAESWSRMLSAGSDGNAIKPGAPDGGSPLKGHPCSSLHPSYRSNAAPCSHNGSLPKIVTGKLSLSQTRQGMRWCREIHSVSEAGLLCFDGSRSDVARNSSTGKFLMTPASSAHMLCHTRHCPPSKAHVGCRKSTVWPLGQSGTRSSETVDVVGKKRKRQGRKINITGVSSQSEHTSTPEEGGEDHFCQWMRSLKITDREKDRASANKREAQDCGSPRQKVSNRKGKGHVFKTEHGDEGACHMRRDRRPHFLPPISQLDCLLNVPIILPENSPPLSPSCAPADPFFPLQVPDLRLGLQRSRRDAAGSEHALKRT